MRKTITLALLVFCALATNVFALGEARLTGKVVDEKDQPIADVKITVTGTEKRNFSASFKTDKKGNIAIFLLDGTVPYTFKYTKEGYTPFEETVKLKLNPERNDRTIRLISAAAAAAVAQPAAAQAVADPAVTAYNEGVELANAGKDAEAIAKFEEAVKHNPNLTAGHIVLAKFYAKAKNWTKTIESGNKALELSPDDEDVVELMVLAYDATGEKTKADEFRKKAPANPAALFNEAARQINAGKDNDAEPLLKQAVELDGTLSVAHYELGMLYARQGKNADARMHLQKYIELDPTGKEVTTAKEMLKYIK